MRIIVLSLILFCCGTSPIIAQSDYIVTTPSAQEIPVGQEEQFIKSNFPLLPLGKWTPGMKFMFVPSPRSMFLPTLSSYETEKGVDNSLLKRKLRISPTGLTTPLASSSNVREENIIMR